MIQAFISLAIAIKVYTWYHNTFSMFLLTFVLWKFIAYVCYRGGIPSKKSTKMKWKMIKDIYKVNPDRWHYEYLNYKDFYKQLTYDNDTVIVLSFFAYQLLRFYFLKNCLSESKIESNENLKRVLRNAQKDIDNKKKEAEQQIETAREINEQVRKNLIDDYVIHYELPFNNAFLFSTAKKFNCSTSDIVESIDRVFFNERS